MGDGDAFEGPMGGVPSPYGWTDPGTGTGARKPGPISSSCTGDLLLDCEGPWRSYRGSLTRFAGLMAAIMTVLLLVAIYSSGYYGGRWTMLLLPMAIGPPLLLFAMAVIALNRWASPPRVYMGGIALARVDLPRVRTVTDFRRYDDLEITDWTAAGFRVQSKTDESVWFVSTSVYGDGGLKLIEGLILDPPRAILQPPELVLYPRPPSREGGGGGRA